MTEQMTRKQLNARIVDEIDRNLKQAFDDMATAPVPDRFAELLEQLKQAEARKREIGDDA
ncbi:NepR family anti-sigma factor [Maliponia aquimaris]|uniref:Anti-sigma factor NepR domain-containing protein n=1 Tax=Maliponia aquimaris TaxID=1673631 RepID=A0A238L1G8_9RHOB|nr:NepR family anti-sigma factor [Maliponia aquimaris]SMX48710.1 hypothetical protein MAA8898_04054 [Maliponia aquimaris]